MKNILSSLNESEKRRILEMHYNASQKQYLTEDYLSPTINVNFKVKDEANFNKLLEPTNASLSYNNETSIQYLTTFYSSLIWAACGLYGNVYNFTIDTTMEEVVRFIDSAVAKGKTNVQTLSKLDLIGSDGYKGYIGTKEPRINTFFQKSSQKNPIPGTQPQKYYTDWQVFLSKYIIPLIQQKQSLIIKSPQKP